MITGSIVLVAALLASAALLTWLPEPRGNTAGRRHGTSLHAPWSRTRSGGAYGASDGRASGGARLPRDGHARDAPIPARTYPSQASRPSRVGIDAAIAAIVARTKGGGDVAEAFEEQGGIRFAVPHVTAARALRVLDACAGSDDSAQDVARTAARLAAACGLSERLGCAVSGCLEAVADDYRRERRADALRRQAAAVPQATIRLLSALPAGTVMCSWLMGADPLPFLLETPQGLCCLAVGSLWYACGVAWTRRELRGFTLRTSRQSPLPFAVRMLHAALARGASIPSALEAVGDALRECDADAAHGVGSLQDTRATRRTGRTRATPYRMETIAQTARRRTEAAPPPDLASALCHAGRTLLSGATWREAWPRAPADDPVSAMRDCLSESWAHGASPTGRLELMARRIDADERTAIEQEAGKLSVRLLAPTGLCFLPAFVCVGVIPAIVSLVM